MIRMGMGVGWRPIAPTLRESGHQVAWSMGRNAGRVAMGRNALFLFMHMRA